MPGRERVGRRLAAWIGIFGLSLAGILFLVLVPLDRKAVQETAAAPAKLLAESVAATYNIIDDSGAHASAATTRSARSKPGIASR